MENIIIPNPEELEKKKLELKKDGIENMHILADFNKTFTKANVNGTKAPSLISHLRNPDKDYLSKSYAKKAQELYDKYHPIEISNCISQEEKSEKMLEWWSTHYKLLIESGLDEGVIEKLVNDILTQKIVQLRQDVDVFFNMMMKNHIPVMILSAAGIGNMVNLLLKKNNLLFPNIYFIGNTLEFDKEGKFLGVKDNKIIHILNKNEKEIEALKVYGEIEKRRNIILLGDSIEDIKMLDHITHKNLIKIAFYNEDNKESLEDFKNNFDIIITNDGSFEFINKLMNEILE